MTTANKVHPPSKVKRVTRSRHPRTLRTGRQGFGWQAQAPSGVGPELQGPPRVAGRVHCQRPVPLSVPIHLGVQSGVAPQLPRRSGPSRQGHPSQARPQVQGKFGRWYRFSRAVLICQPPYNRTSPTCRGTKSSRSRLLGIWINSQPFINPCSRACRSRCRRSRQVSRSFSSED